MFSGRFLPPRAVALATLLLGALVYLATPPAPRASSSDCSGGQTVCSETESCSWVWIGVAYKMPIRICWSSTHYFGP